MHEPSVTVAAIATPPGRGGIGCVRLSGPDARAIAARLFVPRRPEPEIPRTAVFGRILGRDGRPIDHGYRVSFPATASFTGEETVELWAHGSPAVLAEIVRGALAAGAAPAGPGEFTYRALRNGRLDLTRAEAVRDLVAARTVFQARLAHAQAEGALSRRLAPLRESLEDLMARAEAAVEFADEAEVHLADGALDAALDGILEAFEGMLAGYRAGRVVREGATVVLTGRPNVGKSSLFNRLLDRDRAIVDAEPGTTRDTLEETIDLDGVPVRLVDTAGLRETEGRVEGEGVDRARRALEEADIVVVVLDAANAGGAPPSGTGGRVVVWNKIDLVPEPAPPGALPVSARTGSGVDALRTRLSETLIGAMPVEDPILTDARHAGALERATEALRRARGASRDGFGEEIVLEELREARRMLGEITGELHPEALYARIFSTFCIGK